VIVALTDGWNAFCWIVKEEKGVLLDLTCVALEDDWGETVNNF